MSVQDFGAALMQQSAAINRRIVLDARPCGAPKAQHFRVEQAPVPQPNAGQVLLRTLYLSLDSDTRGRMNDAALYTSPTAIGDVMVGATVSRVDASRHGDFKVGDLVVGYAGWQDYTLSSGHGLRTLVHGEFHPSRALGVLGLPGLAAYMGLREIGQPMAGETVVVAAASGAVGSVVGQVARLNGCTVVGIAGGDAKCQYVRDDLHFDRCINHRADDFPARLAAACPAGIDVYFENVGGAVFDAVLPLLNTRARVPVCGLTATYNAQTLPAGPDRLSLLTATLLRKRIRMQGFLVPDDYGHRWNEFAGVMGDWVRDGQVHVREDIVFGLENAPEAFIGLLEGHNLGKLIIQLAHE